MSPIIAKLKKENGYAAISGDFNINPLQINEREKYDDFSIWCAWIILPKCLNELKRTYFVPYNIIKLRQALVSV